MKPREGGSKNTIRQSRTDWKRIDAMKDEDIDYSDAPILGPAFFKNAVLWVEPRKRTSNAGPRPLGKERVK